VLWDATRDEEGKERFPSLIEDLQHLEGLLASGRFELVIIDPVNAYLRGIDNTRDIELRSALGPLAKLAERYRAAVLLVRHRTKSPRDRAIYRGAGGIGYTGAARVEWLVGIHPDDQQRPDVEQRRVIVVIKNNLAPKATPIAYQIAEGGEFRWIGEVEIEAGDLLEPEGKRLNSQSKLDEATSYLEQTLNDCSEYPSNKLISEAKREFDIGRNALFEAKKALGVEAFRKGGEGKRGAGARFWHLNRLTVPRGDSKQINEEEECEEAEESIRGQPSISDQVDDHVWRNGGEPVDVEPRACAWLVQWQGQWVPCGVRGTRRDGDGLPLCPEHWTPWA
jgi:AAA domain